MKLPLATLDAIQGSPQVKCIIYSQAKIGVELDDDFVAAFDSDDFCSGMFKRLVVLRGRTDERTRC